MKNIKHETNLIDTLRGCIEMQTEELRRLRRLVGENSPIPPNPGGLKPCPTCGSDCNERDELIKAEREIERLQLLLQQAALRELTATSEELGGYEVYEWNYSDHRKTTCCPKSEPGAGDEAPCSQCGAPLDTGLECTECGHDTAREIYPADRADG